LNGADLSSASLPGTNLSNANLIGANLYAADLREANLNNAHLSYANLNGIDLSGANLTNAKFTETIFAESKLIDVVGLETCVHFGSSVVDHRTLQKSGLLPIPFLRGVGLPEILIKHLPTLLNQVNQAIQYYSCFINHSTKDKEFAERIHADLQNREVRCWFAPDDMRIGDRILDEIDSAIRSQEKLLLILSEHSIRSDWVEDEVTRAFEEERMRKQTVLFPIRIDDTVMRTAQAWAVNLRARHIGDFTRWKEHVAYQKSFERLMRDLARPKDRG
jgi:hypothetical protein